MVPRKGLEPSVVSSEDANNQEDSETKIRHWTEKWTDILVAYPELRQIVEKWHSLTFEQRYQILRLAASLEGDESR